MENLKEITDPKLRKIIKELEEKVAFLQVLVIGKPDTIESINILNKVIESGLATTASKARDFLARNGITDIEDIKELDDLNSNNKPLIE